MAQALIEDSEHLAGRPRAGGKGALAATTEAEVALLSLDTDPAGLERLKQAISRTGRKVSAVLTEPGDAAAGMPRVLVVGGTRSISALRDALQRVRRSSGDYYLYNGTLGVDTEFMFVEQTPGIRLRNAIVRVQ